MSWTELSSAERQIVERARDVCVGPLADLDTTDHDPDCIDRRAVKLLADAGLFGLNVATEFGGSATGVGFGVTQCLLREEIAYHSTDADVIIALQGFGTALLTLMGTRGQQETWLAALVAGEKISAFALTEPGGGSDVLGMQTKATRDGDKWILDGEKMFISGAPDADVYIVFARSSEGKRGRGITAFLVSRDSPGLSLERGPLLASPHAIGRLVFRQCEVSDDCVLGLPDTGLTAAMGNLEMFRPSVGALAIGVARRARDLAMEFAGSRMLFGQCLIDMPLTQAKLADMWVEIETSREFVLRAARLGDAGGPSGREASLAKLYATEAAFRAVYESQQIYGGRGVFREGEVEALSRVIRATTIYEGSSEVQRLIVGRAEMAPTRQANGAGSNGSTLPSAHPDSVDSSPELTAAIGLVDRTRDLYEQILSGLGATDNPRTADRSLVPFRLTDMVTALEAAELALAEARRRAAEVSPSADAMVAGAVGLILDAAELVRSGADELHHGHDAISRKAITEFNEARHAALALIGSRDVIRLRVSAHLTEGLRSTAVA
jgi:acyl-CoA dehydrogenase